MIANVYCLVRMHSALFTAKKFSAKKTSRKEKKVLAQQKRDAADAFAIFKAELIMKHKVSG